GPPGNICDGYQHNLDADFFSRAEAHPQKYTSSTRDLEMEGFVKQRGLDLPYWRCIAMPRAVYQAVHEIRVSGRLSINTFAEKSERWLGPYLDPMPRPATDRRGTGQLAKSAN